MQTAQNYLRITMRDFTGEASGNCAIIAMTIIVVAIIAAGVVLAYLRRP